MLFDKSLCRSHSTYLPTCACTPVFNCSQDSQVANSPKNLHQDLAAFKERCSKAIGRQFFTGINYCVEHLVFFRQLTICIIKHLRYLVERGEQHDRLNSQAFTTLEHVLHQHNGYVINTTGGRGYGSVGRAVASDSKCPWFESSHWKNWYWTFPVNCIEKTKRKEKRGRGWPINFL